MTKSSIISVVDITVCSVLRTEYLLIISIGCQSQEAGKRQERLEAAIQTRIKFAQVSWSKTVSHTQTNARGVADSVP